MFFDVKATSYWLTAKTSAMMGHASAYAKDHPAFGCWLEDICNITQSTQTLHIYGSGCMIVYVHTKTQTDTHKSDPHKHDCGKKMNIVAQVFTSGWH